MSTPSTPENLFTYLFMNLDKSTGRRGNKSETGVWSESESGADSHGGPAPRSTPRLTGLVYGETRSEQFNIQLMYDLLRFVFKAGLSSFN
jgi:hypothetical protein